VYARNLSSFNQIQTTNTISHEGGALRAQRVEVSASYSAGLPVEQVRSVASDLARQFWMAPIHTAAGSPSEDRDTNGSCDYGGEGSKYCCSNHCGLGYSGINGSNLACPGPSNQSRIADQPSSHSDGIPSRSYNLNQFTGSSRLSGPNRIPLTTRHHIVWVLKRALYA